MSVLQDDGTLSAADIAERVHLSTNACWRRLRRLEADGIIQKRVAIIDPDALGLVVVALVRIRLTDQQPRAVKAFMETVALIDEVVEVSMMASDRTLLLKTYSTSIAAHGRLVERITAGVSVSSVETDFVMQSLHRTTALPM